MREILFKAKAKDTGEWVQGYIYKVGKKVFILRGLINEAPIEVEPGTVCQYTGLTGKNGNKIFEGDIVDYEDEAPGQYEYHDSLIINRGVIEYSEGCFYWTNAVNANLQDSVYKGVADCEVIGNIFDNPELLMED